MLHGNGETEAMPAVTRFPAEMPYHPQPQSIRQDVVYTPGRHIQIGVQADHGYPMLYQFQQQGIGDPVDSPEDQRMVAHDQLGAHLYGFIHGISIHIQAGQHPAHFPGAVSYQEPHIVPAHRQPKWRKALDLF